MVGKESKRRMGTGDTLATYRDTPPNYHTEGSVAERLLHQT